MEHLVGQQIERLRAAPEARRLGAVLARVLAVPRLHARFVNTLARMEYVGVRKMLKSRRSEGLDLDGLQHMLDEAVHALRLKKAAVALAGADARAVATFAEADTLCGGAGEEYFQALDRAAEALLAQAGGAGGARAIDTPPAGAEANYLLTSLAIEVRAQVFYPLYEERLRAAGAPFSVAAILRDEDQHLREMTTRLDAALPGWAGLFPRLCAEEERLFAGFLGAVEAALERAGEPEHLGAPHHASASATPAPAVS